MFLLLLLFAQDSIGVPGVQDVPGYTPGYTPGYAPGYTPGYAPGYTPGYAPALHSLTCRQASFLS